MTERTRHRGQGPSARISASEMASQFGEDLIEYAPEIGATVLPIAAMPFTGGMSLLPTILTEGGLAVGGRAIGDYIRGSTVEEAVPGLQEEAAMSTGIPAALAGAGKVLPGVLGFGATLGGKLWDMAESPIRHFMLGARGGLTPEDYAALAKEHRSLDPRVALAEGAEGRPLAQYHGGPNLAVVEELSASPTKTSIAGPGIYATESLPTAEGYTQMAPYYEDASQGLEKSALVRQLEEQTADIDPDMYDIVGDLGDRVKLAERRGPLLASQAQGFDANAEQFMSQLAKFRETGDPSVIDPMAAQNFGIEVRPSGFDVADDFPSGSYPSKPGVASFYIKSKAPLDLESPLDERLINEMIPKIAARTDQRPGVVAEEIWAGIRKAQEDTFMDEVNGWHFLTAVKELSGNSNIVNKNWGKFEKKIIADGHAKDSGEAAILGEILTQTDQTLSDVVEKGIGEQRASNMIVNKVAKIIQDRPDDLPLWVDSIMRKAGLDIDDYVEYTDFGLDLDDFALHENLGERIDEILGEIVERGGGDLSGRSLPLEDMPTGNSAIREVLKASGYDSVQHVGGGRHGYGTTPHNVIVALDKDQIVSPKAVKKYEKASRKADLDQGLQMMIALGAGTGVAAAGRMRGEEE